MSRHTWMGLGVAALGMGLVLGAPRGEAQSLSTDGTSGTSSGSMTSSDTSQSQQSQALSAAQQQLEVARLRTQVAQLQQQLVQMRTQLAQAQSAAGLSSSNQGVGGSGTAGTSAVGDPNAEAPQGATGLGYTTGTGTGTGGSGSADSNNAPGYAAANVLHTGRVRSVSGDRLMLDEGGGGGATPLTLSSSVRVFRGTEPLSLQSLEEGMRVKTTADFYARGNPVTRIEVLSEK